MSLASSPQGNCHSQPKRPAAEQQTLCHTQHSRAHVKSQLSSKCCTSVQCDMQSEGHKWCADIRLKMSWLRTQACQLAASDDSAKQLKACESLSKLIYRCILSHLVHTTLSAILTDVKAFHESGRLPLNWLWLASSPASCTDTNILGFASGVEQCKHD